MPCQNREFNRIYQGASGCLSVHDMILTICECSCEKSVRYQFKLRRFARRKSERCGCPRKCQSTCGRRSLMTLQPLVIFKKASVKSLLFERCSHFPLVLSLATCQMSLLTASLAIVLFFGFAVAEISAPSCSSTWEWVCILSSLQCAVWFLLDLMKFSFSHSILLAKIHARLQLTCCQHAMGVVSRFFVCFALHWRLILTLLFSVHPRAAAAGIQLRWPRRN